MPYFFYYNKDLNIYTHLKYNRIYDEDEINDLYIYAIKYTNSKLIILKNKEIISEKNNITSWNTYVNKPEILIFSCEENNNEYPYTCNLYNFFENNYETICESRSRFLDLPHKKLYDILYELPSDKVLFNDEYVYFYISYYDNEAFYILFKYLIYNADRIEIIKNIFPNDTTINYKISINKKKRKKSCSSSCGFFMKKRFIDYQYIIMKLWISAIN